MDGVAVFRGEGEYWALAFKGRPMFRLKDSKGLRYIARLIEAPGREFHSVDLVFAGAPPSSRPSPRALGEEGLTASMGDAGEILDPQARAAYRARLSDLEAEIEEAEAFNDPGRAARARDEAEALRRQLSAAFGLHGHARRAGSVAQRARVNVRNNIAAALKAIARHDPELADHFAKAIRTGMYCCYVSDTVWQTAAPVEPIEEPATHALERMLATVLFIGVVDAAGRESRAGEKRMRDKQQRNDELVRRELASAGGRWITSTGDTALAVFDSPADAIRCAVRTLEALRQIKVAARAGLHTGECERRGEDIGGIGVQIGRRIGDLAAAGEVLVSSSVRELVAGSGIAMQDRGFHELRGVPGTWRLFGVTPAGDQKQRQSGGEVGISLMVVDDHPMWRQTLRTVLEGAGLGMVVAEASDGNEAVEMATSARPEVVVMDVNLPSVDGIEATRRLLDNLPETKVLVLSSSDERDDVVAIVKAGASGYLVKTAEPNEVADAVRRIHAGQLVFPPALAKVVLEEFRRLGPQSGTRRPGSSKTAKPRRRR